MDLCYVTVRQIHLQCYVTVPKVLIFYGSLNNSELLYNYCACPEISRRLLFD